MSASTKRLAPYADLHTNPAGPGDARPTALQIVKDDDLINAWGEKVVLITGASAGIGVETARALHATGATIYLGVRSVSKGEAAKASIEAASPGHGAIRILELSLDNLASVRKAAAEFLNQSHRLDVLVNNAGTTGPAFEKTVDGFESQFGTNHLGHFLLTSLLLPVLKATARPGNATRVINVASSAHNLYCDGQIDLTDLDWSRRGYDGTKAYGASKTANILHANHLDRLYGADPEHPVHALSVHPGGIMTAMITSAGELADEIFKLYRDIFKTPEQGAATTVWCAVAKALEGKGGLYCEDCAEAEPAPVVDGQMRKDYGYAPWAKGDHETEVKLWELSEKLVGLR
ncbi:Short-chain dehydrogenase/reductase SDR [Macrophomina phaseolina MS6]|uniref:Short-chain dehydrogenase/reductase SDR n=1 Tax=Macrophomina phaseolina (strain MS6) TaxID=1126212 RepID=K2R5H0_MACPH|nr:Short-chain dehydrogenase/reductase SDR [Macrophomina phaseolina MS6]